MYQSYQNYKKSYESLIKNLHVAVQCSPSSATDRGSWSLQSNGLTCPVESRKIRVITNHSIIVVIT